MAARNLSVVQGQPGVDNVTADHPVRFGEIMLVVTVGAAEGDHGGDGVASASGAPGALLIVRAAWRHVAKSHPGKGADINAHFHRGRAGKHVNGGGSGASGPCERDVLKEEFVFF